jgi:hypothetical protein
MKPNIYNELSPKEQADFVYKTAGLVITLCKQADRMEKKLDELEVLLLSMKHEPIYEK